MAATGKVQKMNDVWKSLMPKQSLRWRALLVGIAAATLSMVAAVAKPPTAKVQPPQASPVIRTLLAGGDARAVVADALTKQTATNTASVLKTASGSSAFGTYAAGVRQLRAALAATHSAWTASAATSARGHLADALVSLHARRLLVDARIAQIDRLAAAPAMPAVAHQRWAAHRDRLVAAVSQSMQRCKARRTNWRRSSKKSAIPAFDRSNRPDRRRISSQCAADVRGGDVAFVSSPSGSARSGDQPCDRAQLCRCGWRRHASCRRLCGDAGCPTVASDFESGTESRSRLHTHLRFRAQPGAHQWYAGAQKGAETTLRTLAGNDVDQASLLIALLRASGAPARYVRGVSMCRLADSVSMLGVREDEVGLALSAAGVPNRPLVTRRSHQRLSPSSRSMFRRTCRSPTTVAPRPIWMAAHGCR